MIEAALVLGGIGCVAALGLGFANLKFAVEPEPMVEELELALPGVNCGACGFTGCHALAVALFEGKADPAACIPGGETVAENIAKILGVEAEGVEKQVAVVHCRGVKGLAVDKGEYLGIPDCRAAALVLGSPKGCGYGCIGYGTCERSCPFDAIHVHDDGLAYVDEAKCTACGKCVEACPKDIIDIRPYACRVHVRCTSPQKGKLVKAVCSVGCIGCQKCKKACPVEAISMQRGLAVIDPEICISCGMCADVCPTENIEDLLTDRGLAVIDPDACIGCTKCVKVCPVDAIEGERKVVHKVDSAKCVWCGRCLPVCPVDAITSQSGEGKRGAA